MISIIETIDPRKVIAGASIVNTHYPVNGKTNAQTTPNHGQPNVKVPYASIQKHTPSGTSHSGIPHGKN